jgi:hypothetical protein
VGLFSEAGRGSASVSLVFGQWFVFWVKEGKNNVILTNINLEVCALSPSG